MLLCEFMYSVLKNINYASKILHKCDVNLGEASKALAETKAKQSCKFIEMIWNHSNLKPLKLQENMI